MPDANVIEGIRDKYRDLSSELDERGRRMWAAVEARSLGRGGIVAVASATGISDRTIRTASGIWQVGTCFLQIDSGEAEAVKNHTKTCSRNC